MRAAFCGLRAQAERRGERDVLRQFVTPDACRSFLRRLGEAVEEAAREQAAETVPLSSRLLDAGEDSHWTLDVEHFWCRRRRGGLEIGSGARRLVEGRATGGAGHGDTALGRALGLPSRV